MAVVGLTYNLIHEEHIGDQPVDVIAEYDSPETIFALQTAIEAGGHQVIPLEADENIAGRLLELREQLDIIFNIAEGLRGESRESYIPQLLETFAIPYVGSGPLCLASCLNKVRTKEILAYYGIPTPPYQVFYTPKDVLPGQLHFPLIAKLSAEGSSMGLSYNSVVDTEQDLRQQVEFLISNYNQPVLVEQFITGREFGIPIIGNTPPQTLPVIEFLFYGEKPITIFVPDAPLEIFKERDYIIPDPKVKNRCPAEIPAALEKTLTDLALRSFRALDCRDWCRLEIRLDQAQRPYVIELNPIAGIDPSYRFAQSAAAAGLDYTNLINRILDYALQRYEWI